MRLATMTNLLMPSKPPKGTDYIESLRRTREAGFTVVDFNMCAMGRGDSELNTDNWMDLVYQIKNEAELLGIEFSQTHLPYPKARRKSPYDDNCELNEFFGKMMEQSIIISSMLGAKWGVVHPVQQIEENELNIEADIKYNHFVYDRFVEMADKYNVGLAFENMADIDNKRRFCSVAPELSALVDDFNTPRVGACWDFGHANRVYGNQIEGIRHIGKRLKATHVDDNIGLTDLHTLPFLGTIPWEKIMKTLTEIGYEGDFVYEIRLNDRMPEDLKINAAKFAIEVGNSICACRSGSNYHQRKKKSNINFNKQGAEPAVNSQTNTPPEFGFLFHSKST